MQCMFMVGNYCFAYAYIYRKRYYHPFSSMHKIYKYVNKLKMLYFQKGYTVCVLSCLLHAIIIKL